MNHTFCMNLRSTIKESGTPLKTIAHKSGYSSQYISAVMHERKPNPTLSFVDCMSKALGVSPFYLLQETVA